MNLAPYTPGEAIELRRRRARFSQHDFGALLGVTTTTVRRWELDEPTRDAPPRFDVDDLSAGEWCWLRRRRTGWTLRDLSKRTGLAVWWLNRAETGHRAAVSAHLVAWWQRFGPATREAATLENILE